MLGHFNKKEVYVITYVSSQYVWEPHAQVSQSYQGSE